MCSFEYYACLLVWAHYTSAAGLLFCFFKAPSPSHFVLFASHHFPLWCMPCSSYYVIKITSIKAWFHTCPNKMKGDVANFLAYTNDWRSKYIGMITEIDFCTCSLLRCIHVLYMFSTFFIQSMLCILILSKWRQAYISSQDHTISRVATVQQNNNSCTHLSRAKLYLHQGS